MQGKALALVLLLLVAVSGCGGGGGDQTAGGSTAGGSTAGGADPTAAGVERIHRSAAQVREERRSEQKGAAAAEEHPSAPAAQAPSHSTGHDPTPPSKHHDSGGGAAQFRVEGGDNSIQDFGSEGGSSERDRAAAVLHAFLDAQAEASWAKACFYLSAELVASIEEFAHQYGPKPGASCGDVLAKLSEKATPAMLREVAEVDVASLRIEGEKAFLIYTAKDGSVNAIPMYYEEGVWKVAGVTGSPLS